MTRCAITGAASGIGRALAARFGRAGHAIVGVDVDAELASVAEAELRAAGVAADFVRADLAEADDRERILTGLAGSAPLDVFVHNAGINCTGRFAESDLARQRAVVELNLVAPMALTAGLLAHDLLAPRATLVFVSSLSRFVGYPGAAAYAATKDALASYARSLAAATAGRGLHVLTVYPGPTRTEHARRHAPAGSPEHRRMPPEELAERVVTAVHRRRRVLIPGAVNRVLALVGHGLPRVTERVMRATVLDRL